VWRGGTTELGGVARTRHCSGHPTARPPCCVPSHLRVIARGSPGPFTTHSNPWLPMPCNIGPDHGVARSLVVLPIMPTRYFTQPHPLALHLRTPTRSLTRAYPPRPSPEHIHLLPHQCKPTRFLTQVHSPSPAPKHARSHPHPRGHTLLRARFARSCGSASRWRRFKPGGGQMCRW